MYFPLDEKRGYEIVDFPDVEYVDPIEYSKYKIFRMDGLFNLELEVKNLGDGLTEKQRNLLIQRFKREAWNEELNKIMEYQLPENFLDFLNCRNKKQQEKIFKNYHFTTTAIQAISFRAWLDYGFTFSFYKSERLPSNIQPKEIPALVHLNDDGSIDKVGKTDLTDGQLKSVIQQRTNVFAKFLDNGKIWHCFLYTADGINGRENGQTSHIHYISSAFGTEVTRERVLKEVKKGKYNLPRMLHLSYEKYA